MAKRRCKNCKDYFLPKDNYPDGYCKDTCRKEALQLDRDKKYKKAQEKIINTKLTKSPVFIDEARPKKKKKSPYKIAKDTAWDQFSIYIRTRDCIRFTGNPEEGMCVTCKRPYAFKKLQAGHFIPGRGNAVLFDERLVYTQCSGCNTNPPFGKGGNYIEYFIFMEQEWGRAKIDEFRNLKGTTIKYRIADLNELEQSFKSKTKDLLTELKEKR